MRTPLLTIGASLLLAGPVVADITLNFDSGWILGGEYTDITSGNTVSGTVTGMAFDLEFDTVHAGWATAGDGGLCFMPSGTTFGSYNFGCGGPNLGDFPPSTWDLAGVPGHYTHYEDLSANPAVIVGDSLIWIHGYSSGSLSRWFGTITLEGVDWDDPLPLCTVEPSPNCVGAPQYSDADYQEFGGGTIAFQTADPMIDGGNVLTLFDLSGTLPLDQNTILGRYSHSTWTGTNLGSIFGLAVDESGNIYVSTTMTWNSNVMGFGGWGAVYKIDTNTGQPSVFTTIPMPAPQSGLGSITYDCDYGQLFVSSFEDGLIYRIDHATGAILDTFDHGTPYAGNAGPTPLGDRPWAVEVHGERLYYSMWNENLYEGSSSVANEIWSVPLNLFGAPVAGQEQLEISLPAYPGENWSSPVADIDFSPEGNMVLGERNQMGQLFNATSISAHRARVFEYECTPSGWTDTGKSFFVGHGVSGTNAAGGVDATTTRTWVSGDALHMYPYNTDNIYGIQGFPTAGGTPVNSVLVDYQGIVSGQDKRQIGDLVVTDIDGGGGGGACCYLVECTYFCELMSEEACTEYQNYTFHPGLPCEEVNCYQDLHDQGACCFEGAAGLTCEQLDESTCLEMNGYWYPGLPCECIKCEDPDPPLGACCFQKDCTLYCYETNELQCSGYSGSTFYPNTSCDAVACTSPPSDEGACCYENPVDGIICVFTDVWTCEKLGGSWREGVPCECIECDSGTSLGPCCVCNGCDILSEVTCDNLGGQWLGSSAFCDDCPAPCPADVDNNGTVDVLDLLAVISVWGPCP